MLALRRRTAALVPALTLALSGLAAVLAPPASAAPPANDNLSGAITLVPGTTASTTTAEATLEGSEAQPTCVGGNLENTVWFKWTSPADAIGKAAIQTSGASAQFDSAIGVWTSASGMYPLTANSCFDDGYGGGSVLTKGTFTVTPSTTYYFQLGMYTGAGAGTAPPGAVDITLSMPENDLLANSLSVNGGTTPTSVAINNALATKQTGEVGQPAAPPFPNCSNIKNTVWYRVTPVSNGTLTVTTRTEGGPVLDTVANVWSGAASGVTAPGSLTAVGCNDDIAGSTNRFSSVTVNVSSSQTYYIQIGSYDTSGVPGRFNADFTLAATGIPANDDLAAAVPALTSGVTTNSTTLNATLQSGENQSTCADAVDHTVWYSWTAASSDPATIETLGGAANFDSVLGVYTASAATPAFPLTEVECDDQSGDNNLSKVEFTPTAGTKYYIQLGNYAGALPAAGDPGPGPVQIKVTQVVAPPANDDIADSLVLDVPEVAVTNNAAATLESGEGPLTGGDCDLITEQIEKSVWYQITPGTSGPVKLDTNATVANRDTVIAIYSGPSLSPTIAGLQPVTCDDEAGDGHRSSVAFVADPTKTYYVQLSTYELDGTTGPITLTSSVFVPAATTTTLDTTVTGRKVDMIAAVHPFDSNDPLTGSVEFFDGAVSLGSVPLSELEGIADKTVDVASPGHHDYKAVFTSTDFRESGSTSEVDGVDITVDTNTLLQGSATGRTENFTATVSGPSGTLPVGKVQLFQDTSFLVEASLVSGQATFQLTDIPLGQRTYHAVYVPTVGSGYNESTSSNVDVTVSEQTVLTLTGSASGTTVTLDASQATAAGSQFPSGSIEFFEGATSKGVKTTTGIGGAQLVLTGVAPGSHTYHAVFTPDAGNGYQAATSADQTITVASPPPAKVASTTTITAPKEVKSGKAPKITITVKRGTAPAAGQVTITIKKLGFTKTVTLAANGTIKVKLPKLVKKAKVQVTYAGNSTTLSSSAKATIKIQKKK